MITRAAKNIVIKLLKVLGRHERGGTRERRIQITKPLVVPSGAGHLLRNF